MFIYYKMNNDDDTNSTNNRTSVIGTIDDSVTDIRINDDSVTDGSTTNNIATGISGTIVADNTDTTNSIATGISGTIVADNTDTTNSIAATISGTIVADKTGTTVSKNITYKQLFPIECTVITIIIGAIMIVTGFLSILMFPSNHPGTVITGFEAGCALTFVGCWTVIITFIGRYRSNPKNNRVSYVLLPQENV